MIKNINASALFVSQKKQILCPAVEAVRMKCLLQMEKGKLRSCPYKSAFRCGRGRKNCAFAETANSGRFTKNSFSGYHEKRTEGGQRGNRGRLKREQQAHQRGTAGVSEGRRFLCSRQILPVQQLVEQRKVQLCDHAAVPEIDGAELGKPAQAVIDGIFVDVKKSRYLAAVLLAEQVGLHGPGCKIQDAKVMIERLIVSMK